MFGMWQGLANSIMSKKANRELGNLINQNPVYTQNPLVGQQFGMAKNLFNARMFGAPEEERNIYGANANFNANVQRNATDASQALALAAAGQGQADQAFSNLQTSEKQNKYGLLENLNNAYAQMIGESDKEYNDRVRRFGDLASIKGAQIKNRTNAVNGLFNGLNSDINQAASLFGAFAGVGGVGGIKDLFSANGGQQRFRNNNQLGGFNPLNNP